MAAEEARAEAEMAFKAYGHPLTMVSSFKYLGSVLSASDDDWPAVVANLRKARKKWARHPRILVREGTDARMPGIFYKAVVQVVLLFGLEASVMTLYIGRMLGGFHHWVACRLTGKQLRRDADGIWRYPPLAVAMVEAGLEEVETYVARRQNTATQYIATRLIMDMYLEAERCPEARVPKRWWEQGSLNLVGSRAAVARTVEAAEEEDGLENGSGTGH